MLSKIRTTSFFFLYFYYKAMKNFRLIARRRHQAAFRNFGTEHSDRADDSSGFRRCVCAHYGAFVKAMNRRRIVETRYLRPRAPAFRRSVCAVSFLRACVAPGRARVRRVDNAVTAGSAFVYASDAHVLEAVLLKLTAENGGAFGLSPVKCAQYASRRCQPDKSYCAPVGGYILC